MDIKIDHAEYKKRHDALLDRIARVVRVRLGDVGMWQDQDTVESLVYDICSLLDGGSGEEVGGKPLRPVLMFADDKSGKHLIAAEGGSWMHEICHEVVDKIYGKKPSV